MGHPHKKSPTASFLAMESATHLVLSGSLEAGSDDLFCPIEWVEWPSQWLKTS